MPTVKMSLKKLQEKKNKEFKRIDKIEKELIEKYKKSKK